MKTKRKLFSIILNNFKDLLKNFFNKYSETKNIDTNIQKIPNNNILYKNQCDLYSIINSSIKDIMIPRSDIIAVSINTSLSDLIITLIKNEFIYIPVYQDSIDNILGTISSNHILSLMQKQSDNWSDYIAPTIFAPKFMTISEALKKLIINKSYSIFIVDEYGGIEGLITRDILLTEINCIQKSRINDEDKMIISREPTIIINGKMHIDDFENEFGMLDIAYTDRERINTIGGFICFIAGYVPNKGEKIIYKNFIFEINESDARRIYKILIKHQI